MTSRALRIAACLALCLPALGQDPYEIGPGDTVHVVVLGQAEMSGEFVVDQEGMLAFPVLGKLKASGLTPSALERKLTTLLTEGQLLKRPQVSVNVKEYRSQQVFVTGEVQRPGRYSLKTDRSLRALLDEVGGLGQNAGHEVIVIRPPESSAGDSPPETPVETVAGALPGEVVGAEVFRLNLTALRSGNPEHDIRLQARDTVFFPPARRIYVEGHVSRPGAYRYEEGITVFQAVALAGGRTERAAKSAKIVRLVDGKAKEFKAKDTDVLQPDDILRIPERLF